MRGFDKTCTLQPCGSRVCTLVRHSVAGHPHTQSSGSIGIKLPCLFCVCQQAKKLKKHRLDRGALMLASPEVRFNMESETHDPIDVEVTALMGCQHFSHSLGVSIFTF